MPETLTTTTPDGTTTTRPVPPSWASVAPLIARWRLSVTAGADDRWTVQCAQPHVERRGLIYRDVPQAIADVAAQCEAEKRGEGRQ